ncbi:acid phosphatase-domain-containing protein [Immersiella caudata]|uniref:Acid phosphatase-domain-containing protein n=1 Tax=Immersiella caudata TaxID=314043 RepID=A0AA39WR62_9PEZI|nr:acid phosphatase-domain-containing protein [Immersiella caudata]
MPRKLSKRTTSIPQNDFSPSTTSQDTTSSTLPTWLTDSLPLPRLIVLDLDYTLWPFYSDIHISTPVRPVAGPNPAAVTDRNGESFSLYRDAPHILHLISSLPGGQIRLAVASKSPVGELCREVLKTLRLPPGMPKGKKVIEVFDGGLEIYEGTKLRHFEVISRRTGIPYEQMLFFDDERPNREVEKLGVTMRLVDDGLSWEELEKGIHQWRRNRGAQ